MKRMIYIPLALLIATPVLASDRFEGDLIIGIRTTHLASDAKSAKFDEYQDMTNGLFGGASVLFDTDRYYMGVSIQNPVLDDQSYEVNAGLFGLGKINLYFDELTHQLSRNALTPAISGIGSNYLVFPAAVPAVSAWTPIDYAVEKKKYGAELTVDPQENPFYFKFSVAQQKSDGIMPYGVTNYSGFEVPMPVDYTTSNLMFEGGYRSKETTAVFTAAFSDFSNKNDLLSVNGGFVAEEYSTPADNYSYNIGGRVVQRLPMNSLLAIKASYTRNISEADWSGYTQFVSPSADGDYDGDVEYIRAGATLSSQWSTALDTRLFYNYVDRNNDSESITDPLFLRTNHQYEYNKHEAGLDANYRLNKNNKLSGGYQFTYMDQNREDADTTADNLLFAQLKNSSLDWLTTKFRLEYLNRSSDTDYSAATLAGDGIIHQYFTPFDYASKDRYKAKLAFDINPFTGLDLGLSYTLVYDDYNGSLYGVQNDQRHEFYLDVNAQLPAKIRLNSYIGYELTKSDFDARYFFGASPAPSTPDGPNSYQWNQETTYDFFVIGGSLSVPVLHQLELVFNADYQLVDGNIDFARSAAAGVPLESVTDADDYSKIQLGAKAIYQVTDAWALTLGYLFEKAELDEWKYTNYSYAPGFPNFYLSGAGLDSNYEAHQFYLITTFHF